MNSSDEQSLLQTTMSGLSKRPTFCVLKRGSRGYEPVCFDKITSRIELLCKDLAPEVSPTEVAKLTISSIYSGITTEEIDAISAEIAYNKLLIHNDYAKLAVRLLVSNMHKTTPATFSAAMAEMHATLCLISDDHAAFIAANAESLDAMIVHERDYDFEYVGYRTMMQSYLHKTEVPRLDPFGSPIWLNAKGETVDPATVTLNALGVAVIKDAEGRVVDRPFRQSRERLIDRPQYMYMRAAVATYMGVGQDALKYIQLSYFLQSMHYYTHATPTLFNSCTPVQQLNSCFLLGTADSQDEIMRNATNSSIISKYAGGIGIHMSNIRSRDRPIKGTNGKSSGLPQQLKIFNSCADCWDQGGRRKGAFAIYVEPWHGDILQFLKLKLNHGAESEHTKDLFYALWIPDLFIKRAREDTMWSLFSEDSAPGLSEVYDGMPVCKHCDHCPNPAYAKFVKGDASISLDGHRVPDENTRCPATGEAHEFGRIDVFTQLYTRYEDEGRATGYVAAGTVVKAIASAQRSSGTPYILFKDHCNRMSNQDNIGTIKSSNLCTEIIEWSNKDSYACCTLASINLKKFVTPERTYDHAGLESVVRHIVRSLDIIIDVNVYPVPNCVENSRDFRPIGVGVQGLADTFAAMGMAFLSPEAQALDLAIFETIYYAAIDESRLLALAKGAYRGFRGSPASRGLLHPDLWLENQQRIGSIGAKANIYSGRYDFGALRQAVVRDGLRNSLVVALMPTVSTGQILGNTESFEPFKSLVYTKTMLSGKITIVNRYLMQELQALGLWSAKMATTIINANSVQGIRAIPADVKARYLTVYEMKQKPIRERAALRAAFIDQSSSLNVYTSDNTNATMRGIMFNGWDLGLKTGSYYINTVAAVGAMKNNITDTRTMQISPIRDGQSPTKSPQKSAGPVCTMQEGCISCSS